jgi:hypothetical protein
MQIRHRMRLNRLYDAQAFPRKTQNPNLRKLIQRELICRTYGQGKTPLLRYPRYHSRKHYLALLNLLVGAGSSDLRTGQHRGE